jgi:membrane-associated phospholipid phosphatase
MTVDGRSVVLGALIGGVTTSLTGFLSQSPLQVVLGGGLIVLSAITLLQIGIAARQSAPGAATAPKGDPATRWGWACVANGLLFLALAVTVRITGVLPVERAVFEAVTALASNTDFWHTITRLGSEDVLFPASVFLIVLLPRHSLRHWWVWAAVMLAASGLEGLGKEIVARSRPESLRPGFPSGHVSAAAAFHLMAAYLAAGAVRRRWAKGILAAAAAVCIGLVAVSRMALRVHWPLDVLGGAALGVGLVAAAVWWHERHPDAWWVLASIPPAWAHTIYHWQSLSPVALFALLFVRPPWPRSIRGSTWPSMSPVGSVSPGGSCCGCGWQATPTNARSFPGAGEAAHDQWPVRVHEAAAAAQYPSSRRGSCPAR